MGRFKIVDVLHAVADCHELLGTLTLNTMINVLGFPEKPEVFILRGWSETSK